MKNRIKLHMYVIVKSEFWSELFHSTRRTSEYFSLSHYRVVHGRLALSENHLPEMFICLINYDVQSTAYGVFLCQFR